MEWSVQPKVGRLLYRVILSGTKKGRGAVGRLSPKQKTHRSIIVRRTHESRDPEKEANHPGSLHRHRLRRSLQEHVPRSGT